MPPAQAVAIEQETMGLRRELDGIYEETGRRWNILGINETHAQDIREDGISLKDESGQV